MMRASCAPIMLPASITSPVISIRLRHLQLRSDYSESHLTRGRIVCSGSNINASVTSREPIRGAIAQNDFTNSRELFAQFDELWGFTNGAMFSI